MKLPEFLENLIPQDTKKGDLTVKVTMMGGRRCGKTSVLAAMEDCFQRTIYKDTNITCYSEDETTLQVLREKNAEMDAYFADRKSRAFQPDSTPTLDIVKYSFFIGLRGPKRKKEDGRINLVFNDYPGEWLDIHRNDLVEALEESRIIIIAIDTPYMMEEGGKYNKTRNYCKEISNAIIQAGFADKDEPGMILFVPIKCEKYRNLDSSAMNRRHAHGMRDVVAAVKGAYATLIDYISGSVNCFAAITPVYTLGDAVFSDFERDDDGEIILDSKYKVPQKANYIFTDNAGSTPNPLFCEQPLFYILAFVLSMANREKERGGVFTGILNKFQEAVLHWPTAEEYMEEYGVLAQKIKETREKVIGYEIISNCSWMKNL